jgi:hypothetical protein
MKIKNTLIDDFIKINNSINCDYEYCSCTKCSKRDFCEFIGNLIDSMRKYYSTSTEVKKW